MAGQRSIVILGASYARGWRPEDGSGLQWINRGVNGEQSWQLLDRFDADVAAGHPTAVVIWGFINDVFRAAPGEIADATGRARASLAALVERAQHHRIEPVIATEVTIRGRAGARQRIAAIAGRLAGKRSYHDRINGEVRAVNDWLRATASERGLLLLDFEQVLSDRTGSRCSRFATPDGSHISPQGYAALTAYAVPLVLRRFAAPS